MYVVWAMDVGGLEVTTESVLRELEINFNAEVRPEEVVEIALYRFANTNTSAVMHRHKAHAAGAVAGKALGSHISHDIRPVLDIGCLTERRIRS